MRPDKVSDDFKSWIANSLRTQAAYLDAHGYHEEATEKLKRAERLESLMEGK